MERTRTRDLEEERLGARGRKGRKGTVELTLSPSSSLSLASNQQVLEGSGLV